MSVLGDHVDQILLSPAEALAAVSAWEQQTALLGLALRHVETTGSFATEGAVSMKAWLRDKARMTDQTAGNLLSLGRFLDTNTAFADAALTGALSGGQLSVAKRLGQPKYASLLAEQQHDLVHTLASLDITNTTTAVAHWRSRADAVLDDGAPPIEPPNELHLARTLDHRLHGTFSLDDAAATELEKAIHNARTWEGTDDTRTVAEQQGDALFDIAAFFNKNHDGDGTPRHLPTISLSADVTTITTDTPQATNDDTGRPVSPACTSTYLCDCRIHIILRDADGAPEHFGRATYTVPSDNPFVGVSGARPEIWSVGVRNPWRFNFDSASGDLWIGDVGQGQWEEIDLARAVDGGGRGINFGWSAWEGTHRFNDDQPDGGATMPIFEYEHGEAGCSVSGGDVYRGTALPSLVGWYLFSDYCSGIITALQATDGELTGHLERGPLAAVSAINAGPDGELYVLSLGDGVVYRVAPAG